jgi:hypothetical protein
MMTSLALGLGAEIFITSKALLRDLAVDLGCN